MAQQQQQGMGMEDLMSAAASQGMMLVNSDEESADALFAEYAAALKEAEALCEVVDPESAPFESKYKARTLLDEMAKKLEANRTIAMLEKQKLKIAAIDKRLATIRVRVGGISFDCEEPHNAQTDLELACQYFFPQLVELIEQRVKSKEPAQNDDDNTADPAAGGEQLQLKEGDLELSAGILVVLKEDMLVDAMKQLNLLGILWSNRGQLYKALLYLTAASRFYEMNTVDLTAPGAERELSSSVRKHLGDVFTHNLFYLAQAYGHLGDTKKSSAYCRQTLQRQHAAGLEADIRSALDWVRNCGSIADFYLAMKQYKNCALALASAEGVLKHCAIAQIQKKNAEVSGLKAAQTAAPPPPPDAADGNAAAAPPPALPKELSREPNNFISGNINAAEIEAELSRRWATLYISVLRGAYDRAKKKETLMSLGAFDEQLLDDDESIDDATAEDYATTEGAEGAAVEFFDGLSVQLPTLLDAKQVKTFDDARTVFLRAAARIDFAKKYFVLDGHVTDHVTLTQDHSKLYHFLACFETDTKRKLAMENRRLEILVPLLGSLNKTSFEVLHKQLSYELGETALGMVDIKLDKFRERDLSGSGEVDVRKLKKAEINKCNEYCKTALAMFAHFTHMYAPLSPQNATILGSNRFNYNALREKELHELTSLACTEPDEALISEEEVRPFLNAHFLSCRVMSKVIVTPANIPSGAAPALYLIACLKRYEWLCKFSERICERRGVSVDDAFGDEIRICREMVQLLPSKIDRMCYRGESGLSL